MGLRGAQGVEGRAVGDIFFPFSLIFGLFDFFIELSMFRDVEISRNDHPSQSFQSIFSIFSSHLFLTAAVKAESSETTTQFRVKCMSTLYRLY